MHSKTTNPPVSQKKNLPEFKYNDIIQAADSAMLLIDKLGIIHCYNNEFKNLYPQAVCELNFFNLLGNERDIFLSELSNYKPGQECPIIFKIKHERGFDLSIRFKKLPAKYKLDYFLGSAQIEHRIDENSIIQQLINTFPDLIYIKDSESRFIQANNWVAKIIGVNSPKELIGKTDFDFFPKQLANKYYTDERKIISSGIPLLNCQEKVITGGKIKWYSTTKIPLYDTHCNIKGIMGIGRDITQNVKEAKALERAKIEAEKADRLKSAFLANLSHEIRTPLNGILGFSQFLKQKTHSEEKQHKYLDIIHANGKQLLMLINDIIDVSMIESNQLSIKTHQFSVNSILLQLKSNFEHQIIQKGVNIKLIITPGLPDGEDLINSDDFRLNQILNNLISNALKFTSEGIIEVGYKNEDNVLVFYVSDTGIGIDPLYQKEIFKRFRQADESMTRDYGGTGLGLSICRGLVNLLGGRVWVKSKLGEGSTFYFTLPFSTDLPSKTHRTKNKKSVVY